MLANVLTTLPMMGGTAVLGGAASLGAMNDVLGAELSNFVEKSPTALAFAKAELPNNRLLTRTSAQTLAALREELAAKPQKASLPARIVSGITSVGIGALPALITGAYVYQQTSSVATACAVAAAAAADDVDAAAAAAGAGAGAAGVVAAGAAAAAGAGAAAAGVAGAAAGAAAVLLYPKLALFLDRLIFGRTGALALMGILQLESFLNDPANVQRFFGESPEELVRFLREGVSQTFRQKEGEANSRMDLFRAKAGDLERARDQRIREIEASGIPNADKARLIQRVTMAAQEGIAKLNEAIGQESTLAQKLGEFIEEVMRMTENISRDIDDKRIYDTVEDFVDSAREAVDGMVARGEDRRREAIIDLAQYMQRIAAIGQEVSLLLEAQREVNVTLLESPL